MINGSYTSSTVHNIAIILLIIDQITFPSIGYENSSSSAFLSTLGIFKLKKKTYGHDVLYITVYIFISQTSSEMEPMLIFHWLFVFFLLWIVYSDLCLFIVFIYYWFMGYEGERDLYILNTKHCHFSALLISSLLTWFEVFCLLYKSFSFM